LVLENMKGKKSFAIYVLLLKLHFFFKKERKTALVESDRTVCTTRQVTKLRLAEELTDIIAWTCCGIHSGCAYNCSVASGRNKLIQLN
jgi:hypothetical protein